jgi:hypothetical protein
MSAALNKAWHLLLQNGRCVLCGEPLFLELSPHAHGGPTFEHKTPQNAGGAFGRFNRALSHRECNQWRGDRAVLSCVRPPALNVAAPEGRRPLVPMSGIWFSHFRLPLTDPRWRRGSDSTGLRT